MLDILDTLSGKGFHSLQRVVWGYTGAVKILFLLKTVSLERNVIPAISTGSRFSAGRSMQQNQLYYCLEVYNSVNIAVLKNNLFVENGA